MRLVDVWRLHAATKKISALWAHRPLNSELGIYFEVEYSPLSVVFRRMCMNVWILATMLSYLALNGGKQSNWQDPFFFFLLFEPPVEVWVCCYFHIKAFFLPNDTSSTPMSSLILHPREITNSAGHSETEKNQTSPKNQGSHIKC